MIYFVRMNEFGQLLEWYQSHIYVSDRISFCPTDTNEQCVVGQGEGYRGTWSISNSGAECINWNSTSLRGRRFTARKVDANSLGLGNHNFCRYVSRVMCLVVKHVKTFDRWSPGYIGQSDACSYPHNDWFNLVAAAKLAGTKAEEREELMIWVLQYFDCNKKSYCRSHIVDFPHNAASSATN